MSNTAQNQTQERKINSMALASIFSAIFMLIPVSIILASIAIWQIYKKPEKGNGYLFPILALFMSVILQPLAIYTFINSANSPSRAFDACRSIQEEGFSQLHMVHYLEKKYKDEHDRYGTLKEIRFKQPGNGNPYLKTLLQANADSYLVEAKGLKQMDGDLLHIDQSGSVTIVQNKCQQPK